MPARETLREKTPIIDMTADTTYKIFRCFESLREIILQKFTNEWYNCSYQSFLPVSVTSVNSLRWTAREREMQNWPGRAVTLGINNWTTYLFEYTKTILFQLAPARGTILTLRWQMLLIFIIYYSGHDAGLFHNNQSGALIRCTTKKMFHWISNSSWIFY